MYTYLTKLNAFLIFMPFAIGLHVSSLLDHYDITCYFEHGVAPCEKTNDDYLRISHLRAYALYAYT